MREHTVNVFSGSLPVDGRDLNGFEISSTSRFPGRHLGDEPKFKRRFPKSRIAYCTAKYSSSFQLLDDSSVLLILGGDISQNPGPVKDPCSVCGKWVAKNRALSCNGCKKWCHIGIKCGNVSNQQYKKY